MKKTLFLAAVIVLAGCESGAEKSSARRDISPEDTAATVNGVPIPKERIQIYATAGGGTSNAEVIENMITSELLAQEAKKAGMLEDPEVIEQLAVAEQTVLGRAFTQKFLGDNPVSDEDLQARYTKLQEEYREQYEYRSSHILVEDAELAQKLHGEIRAAPEKFAELAKEHSIDAGSGEQGGDLGWVSPATLVPEYGAALKDTPPGHLTGLPVKTQYGWHIIYVADKRPVTVPPLGDEMRQRIRQSVQAEKFSAYIEELRGKAQITRTP